MPFIDTKTNVKITDDAKERLAKEFGKAIELIPGKSERWLMLNFSDECKMSFSGSFSPCAISEVKVLGKADAESYQNLTKKLTEIFEQVLSIPSDRVFIKYDEYSLWGHNGANF